MDLDAAANVLRWTGSMTTGSDQEWLGRWTAKLGEDSQRLLADSQKLMEASSRFIANGWAVRGA